MGATTARLMTVEEYRKLPKDDGPFYHELRHGELVPAPQPKIGHHLIQDRLADLLRHAAGPLWYASAELAFRALPEYELRVADVGVVTKERLDATDLEDNLHGAPELVIEALSPSNTSAEMNDNRKLCLENGTKEFWVLDRHRRQVKVSTPGGHSVTWHSGQEIPLPLFGDVRLRVDDIFA
ncbi:MAG TPA: Uma2 family endonuclease [Bryobacteraceae bacterium]